MRKILFSVLLFCAPCLAIAQGGVVSAPILENLEAFNKGTLIKQLDELVKAGGTMAKTYDEIKKSVELYYKVSDILKGADIVVAVINKQIDLINACSVAYKAITEVKGANLESIARVRDKINNVRIAYQENIKLIREVMTDDQFKMDDWGRIQLAMKIDERTDNAIKKVNRYRSAFEGAASMKALVRNNY